MVSMHVTGIALDSAMAAARFLRRRGLVCSAIDQWPLGVVRNFAPKVRQLDRYCIKQTGYCILQTGYCILQTAVMIENCLIWYQEDFVGNWDMCGAADNAFQILKITVIFKITVNINLQ